VWGGRPNNTRKKKQHEEESLEREEESRAAWKGKHNNMRRRLKQREEETITTWRGEVGKWKSGAQAEFEPHFILDLGFLFFLGLIVAPTTNFPLVTAYTGAHNFFFLIMVYIGAHNFVLILLTTYMSIVYI